MPAPKSLAGRVALVTGGAGGIGSATAERYLREGACVLLADIDDTALAETAANLSKLYSSDVVRTVNMNVTDEQAVIDAYSDVAAEFGGVDILFLKRRDRKLRTRRGNQSRNVEQEHGYPFDRVFSRQSRSVQAFQNPKHGWRSCLCRLQERLSRIAKRLGLLHSKGL